MNLIIGKNSFIAKKLLERDSFKFTSSNKLDKESFYLKLEESEKFDYSILNNNTNIIFLAAISSPDECNNKYDYAYRINVIGTKCFIKEALKRGAKVLFFSSDVIYGNTIEKVDEQSKTNPFGNYAKMKDEVEKAFENKKNFKVFRLSYVLSKEDKYLKYLKYCVDNNQIAEVFHPFYRKVIYIEDVLDAIERIIKKWDSFDNQKFNICGQQNISRKDISIFYNNIIDNNLKCVYLEPSNNFWKARPKDINIITNSLDKLLEREVTKIEDAIKIILKGE